MAWSHACLLVRWSLAGMIWRFRAIIFPVFMREIRESEEKVKFFLACPYRRDSVASLPVATTNHKPNQPTEQTMKTTVILFRAEGEWTLASYKGGTIRSVTFNTATEARSYAKSKRWSVRRAANCDAKPTNHKTNHHHQ